MKEFLKMITKINTIKKIEKFFYFVFCIFEIRFFQYFDANCFHQEFHSMYENLHRHANAVSLS